MRPSFQGDTSAFVVSNVHETIRAAPAAKASRPIDVPTSSRSSSHSRPAIKNDSSEQNEYSYPRAVSPDSGLEDDLQFLVDDVVSLPSETACTGRQYSRAICLSFSALESEKAAPMNGLEGKVKQLVAKAVVAAGDADADDRGALASLATYLRKHGLQVEVTPPPKPSALTPLSTRSINEPFLVVTAPKAVSDRDDSDLSESNQPPQVVIIDAALRRHLAMAPATPAYERAMASAVPDVFVGTLTRLTRLVSLINPAIAANFTSQGMEQPPWRRKSALLYRWSGVVERERVLRLQWEDLSRDQQASPSPEKMVSEPVVADDGEVMWPAGMPAVPLSRKDAAAAVVSIMGFAVGSVAVGNEPWGGAEPGSFAGNFSRESQAESDLSSADSEDVIAGLSPVSVFKDAPPAALMVPKAIVVGGF